MFERTRREHRLPLAIGAMAVILLTGVGGILVRDWQTERQLQKMPIEARRLLFENLQSTLRTSCSCAASDTVLEYCQEQAQLLARFPECGVSCQDLCKHYVPRATK